MTACIAADVIAANADDEGVIKRMKQYFFVATENNLRDKSNGKNMVVQAGK